VGFFRGFWGWGINPVGHVLLGANRSICLTASTRKCVGGHSKAFQSQKKKTVTCTGKNG